MLFHSNLGVQDLCPLQENTEEEIRPCLITQIPSYFSTGIPVGFVELNLLLSALLLLLLLSCFSCVQLCATP